MCGAQQNKVFGLTSFQCIMMYPPHLTTISISSFPLLFCHCLLLTRLYLCHHHGPWGHQIKLLACQPRQVRHCWSRHCLHKVEHHRQKHSHSPSVTRSHRCWWQWWHLGIGMLSINEGSTKYEPCAMKEVSDPYMTVLNDIDIEINEDDNNRNQG